MSRSTNKQIKLQVDNTPFGEEWDGSLEAASKNAIYDSMALRKRISGYESAFAGDFAGNPGFNSFNLGRSYQGAIKSLSFTPGDYTGSEDGMYVSNTSGSTTGSGGDYSFMVKIENGEIVDIDPTGVTGGGFQIDDTITLDLDGQGLVVVTPSIVTITELYDGEIGPTGTLSFSVGRNNISSGYCSSSIGLGNLSSGSYAISAGTGNEVGGFASLGFGYGNKLLDNYCTSIGFLNEANAIYATVVGGGLVNNYKESTVVGFANDDNSSYLEPRLIVGVGSNRNGGGPNAIRVRKDGLVLLSTGEALLPQYGSGSFLGTAAYNLGVDADGNIIEVSSGGGTIPELKTVDNESLIGTGDISIGVTSVSGDGVDNGNPNNPVISFPNLTDLQNIRSLKTINGETIEGSGDISISGGGGGATSGGVAGLFISDRDETNYGTLGSGAIDLSISSNTSSSFGATGLKSIAIGNDIGAVDTSGISIGDSISDTDFGAIHLGYQLSSNLASLSILIGALSSINNGNRAVVIGAQNQAAREDAVVIGATSKSTYRGIAIGREADSYIGDGTSNNGEGIAIGYRAKANNATNTIAIGSETEALAGQAVIGAVEHISQLKSSNYIWNVDQDLSGRDGEVMTYNSVTGEIELKASSGGGGGSSFQYITESIDVDNDFDILIGDLNIAGIGVANQFDFNYIQIGDFNYTESRVDISSSDIRIGDLFGINDYTTILLLGSSIEMNANGGYVFGFDFGSKGVRITGNLLGTNVDYTAQLPNKPDNSTETFAMLSDLNTLLGSISMVDLPTYETNADALLSLPLNTVYKTTAGDLRIVVPTPPAQ
jgi:hypothetical protein